MTITYPNGQIPNLCVLRSCGTCVHSSAGYEGEIDCTRFTSFDDSWQDPGDAPVATSVSYNTICDQHEERAR